MIVKNLLMIPANSVAGIFMLFVACNLVIPGTSEMNSTIISTIAPNISHKVSNNSGTVDSSNVIESQIDLEIHTTVSSILELENYINLTHQQNCQNNITRKHYDLVTGLSLEITKLNTNLSQQQEKISKFMKNYVELNSEYMKLNKSHSIDKQNIETLNEKLKSLQLHNYEMENYLAKEKENNKILFDANTLLENKLSASLLENKVLNNQLSQLKDTFDESSQIYKKYTKTLENLITCENRVLSLNDHQVNLEKNLTILEVKMKDILDEVDLQKNEKKNIIEKSNELLIMQRNQFEAIENKYHLNLTNKQQELTMLKEIVFDINQKDLVESANLLKTLISIMKFNEHNVPDDLLEKRRHLLQTKYNENQAVVVDDLRKLFDDITLTSTNQLANRYFCNKKISYYNSTICECLSKKLNCHEIILSYRNLAVLPKDIFSGFENIKNLDLSYNQLYYLESGTFNNLPNLQRLDLGYNNLTALPSDIFNGLEKLEELYLSSIELNSLQPGTFDNLSNLKILHIHQNYLTSLPKDIFKGLEKLEVLYLHVNKLNTIQPGTFNNLKNLQDLYIYENNLSTHEKLILTGSYNFKNLHVVSYLL